LITATVEAILAQRLVRRICTQCREEVQPSESLLTELGLQAAEIVGQKFFRGRGCDICNNTGYKGRVGLFELMIMNDELRELIMQNAPTDEVRNAARANGMVTLRDAGMSFVNNGTTTIEEVVRETIIDA
jgi:type IV pilus assembly protein PilB